LSDGCQEVRTGDKANQNVSDLIAGDGKSFVWLIDRIRIDLSKPFAKIAFG
jgi:hypothetical protein